jgi:hypothetical protein
MAETGNQRLDSWKEIAAYLKRDVRTAMRWAKERGLPVHRTLGGRRSGVCAFTAEIDAWLEALPPGSLTAAEQPNGVPSLDIETAAQVVLPRSARASRWLWMAMGAIVALGLVGTGMLLTSAKPASGPPVRADFSGNSIRAWDISNRMVWQYQFPQPLATVTTADAVQTGNVRVYDLFGNGQKEVLAVARFAPNQSVDEIPAEALYCFSQAGKVLWKYEPNITLTFGSRRYGPPWMLGDLVVSDNPGPKTIWLLGVDPIWSKSFVARIDAQGQASVQFVNSGMLASLNRISTPQGNYLWMGGFNDEYDSGSLAIMRDTQLFASSPQTPGTRYACIGCPPGSPLAYFVFPHYEIGRLLHPVDYIQQIFPEGNIVQIVQAEVSNVDTVIYAFSNTISPAVMSVSYSETFWPHYQELKKNGKIHEPLSKFPDRLHPPPVRVFENGSWHTVEVTTDYWQR